MSRDIPPYGLRMPAELKKRLEEESVASGRSLNAELIDRLRRSLEQQDLIRRNEYSRAADPDFPADIARTDAERATLSLFRGLSHEKQLALLALLK